jgi:hypothetical protein
MAYLAYLVERSVAKLPPWVRSVNGRLALWLAVIAGCLFLGVGVVNRWHHGGGEDSVGVDVLWHTVWIIYQVLKVWLIVVVAILLYRRVQRPSV